MQHIPRTPLQGRRVLVVEDEYVLAEDLCRALDAQGAKVLGPASQVRAALELLARGDVPDLAILDVNLGGEMVFPVADALRRLGIPFVFATEYGQRQVPSAHAEVPQCEKPIDLRHLVRVLAMVSG
jgi:CheY-like chemotaxis protein